MSEFDCPICYEPIEGDKNCTVTECNHKFHTSCLVTSLSKDWRCPVCRHAFREIEDNSDSEDEDESEFEPNELSFDEFHEQCNKLDLTYRDLTLIIAREIFSTDVHIPDEEHDACDEKYEQLENLFDGSGGREDDDEGESENNETGMDVDVNENVTINLQITGNALQKLADATTVEQGKHHCQELLKIFETLSENLIRTNDCATEPDPETMSDT